jgi:hypothetical protein
LDGHKAATIGKIFLVVDSDVRLHLLSDSADEAEIDDLTLIVEFELESS